MANLYGVPGKQFRAAVLKIPGSEMGIELVQWGEARKPKAGPGAVTLMLRRPGAIRTAMLTTPMDSRWKWTRPLSRERPS